MNASVSLAEIVRCLCVSLFVSVCLCERVLCLRVCFLCLPFFTLL